MVNAALQQATDTATGEPLFVNKYGQLKPLSQVSDLLVNTKTQKFALTDLTDVRTSAPATVSGGLAPNLTTLSSDGIDFAQSFTGAATGQLPVAANSIDNLKNLFNISIDGIGKINDYQRTGAVWAELESNLFAYQRDRGSKYALCVATTWTLFNTNHAVEFMRWIVENLPSYSVHSSLLYSPKHLSINNLPQSIKDKIIKDITAYTQHDHMPWVQHCKTLLIGRLAEAADVHMDIVRNNITKLDAIRQDSLQDVDSELYHAIYTI